MIQQVSSGAAARRSLFALSLLGAAAVLVGCKSEPASAPPLPAAPLVSVEVIAPQNVVVHQMLVGRADASQISAVRPQVGGLIQERLFVEGDVVQQGQALYQIDPRPFDVALAAAQGQLAKAQAAAQAAREKADRYKALAALDAATMQERDDLEALAKQSEAAVVVAQADVQAAELNLEYTKVVAPITGTISTSAVTPGALVTANQGDALATIHKLDVLNVDLTQSSAELLALRKQHATGSLQQLDGDVAVELVLEDGSTYAHKGSLRVVGSRVSQSTGTVDLRVSVPNPDRLLLPGSYVKALVPTGTTESAILLAQTYVTRTPRGDAMVKVVNEDSVVAERVVQATTAIKDKWLITEGLAMGDQVITAGGSSVRAGQVVSIAPVKE